MSGKGRKLNARGRRVLRLAFVFFLGVFLFSTYQLYTILHAYQAGNDTYERIAADARHSSRTEEETDEISFDVLREINGDVIGWLELPETVIDYPVVQGKDNAYYLEHLFNHDVNHMGSLFMDYRSDPSFADRITPVYGHHTNSGAMFCILENYKEQSFYDDHPVFIYTTPEHRYLFEAYAGTLMDAKNDFLRTSFGSDGDYLNYIRDFRRRSTFLSDTEITAEDRAVFLLTCTADFEDARYVLVCRLTQLW